VSIDPGLRPLTFAAAADDAEELARAEVYGVLAALFYAPPDAAMLAQFQVAVTEAPVAGAFLEASWSELVGAARRLDAAQIAAEFDTLFQGVGKPEVFLYGSFYLAGKLNEKPLVAVRHSLRELGLARSATVNETEDHLASLCEVMRYLIAGDEVEVANLAHQSEFFATHIQPWVNSLCDVLAAHPKARFYAGLAGFTRSFISVEVQGFDMLDGAG
jgi:TorA maturation chaperone TorD